MHSGLSDVSAYLDDAGEPSDAVLAQARSALQGCIATGEVVDEAVVRTPVETAAPAPRSFNGRHTATSRWRRLTVVATLAAATIAAVVVPLSLRSRPAPVSGVGERQHVAPLADTAATPKGWAAVAYENAQISVPAAWYIESPGFTCSGGVESVIFIGAVRRLPSHMTCSAPANVVSLWTATSSPIPHGHSAIVNGIHVELGWTGAGPTRTYIERGLGMGVTARGPLARRVLVTFTHSPLSVVLGSSVRTPAGWRTVDFGGLQFAVPPSWKLTRVSWWGGCPFWDAPDVLQLSTARTLSMPSCPIPETDAGHEAAVPTMVVGAGPQVPTAGVPGERCVSRNRLRICIEPPPLNGGYIAGRQLSLLTALVYLPGQAHPDQIEIGLVGSGLTPLGTFDSLRPSGS